MLKASSSPITHPIRLNQTGGKTTLRIKKSKQLRLPSKQCKNDQIVTRRIAEHQVLNEPVNNKVDQKKVDLPVSPNNPEKEDYA